MADLYDPFAFLPMPQAEVYVNETFAELGLRPEDMPALHTLMVKCVELPESFRNDSAKAHAWERVMLSVLDGTARRVRLARAHCTPHFSMPGEVSEAFLCACVLTAMPDGGRAQVYTLAHNRHYGGTLMFAAAIYDDYLRMGQEKTPSRASYERLPRTSRLMVEMHAVKQVTHALRHAGAQTPEAPCNSLCAEFLAVARYRPLMHSIDSSMAGYFKHLDRILMTRHGQNRFAGPSQNATKEGVVVTFRPRVNAKPG